MPPYFKRASTKQKDSVILNDSEESFSALKILRFTQNDIVCKLVLLNILSYELKVGTVKTVHYNTIVH